MQREMSKCLEYYREHGLSIIPIPYKSKAATIKLGGYQKRLPTDAEIQNFFSRNSTNIAAVCGEVSGNLFVLDFDEESKFYNWAETAQSKLDIDDIYASSTSREDMQAEIRFL